MTDTPEPYVLDIGDATYEEWDDERGSITFRTTGGAAGCTNGTFTTGVAELQPGGRLRLHRHSPAEMYYILDGHGTVTLDDTEHPVKAGATVFIPAECRHGVHNTGDSPLRFFYSLAAASFGEIEYRFE